MNASPRDVGEMTVRDDPEGPGSQLREARHRANFSVEQVSTELHLNADTVRALEENRFDGLPAPAFVRGYMRSYARLLNLPPGPILEAYDQKGFTPPTIVPDITQQPQAKSTDVPMRLATYMVAAGLVVMVVMWWQTREAPLAVSDELSKMAAVAEAAGRKPASSDTRTAGARDSRLPASTNSQDPGDSEAGSDAAAAAVTGSLPAESEPGTMPTDPAPMLSDQALAPLPEIASLAPSLSADTAANPAGNLAAATTAPDDAGTAAGLNAGDPPGHRLDLAFEQESWVEVYDGKGNRLVYQLAIQGERMTLDAEPPIRVVLGYAEGTKVAFNSRELDVGPFTQRGTARFVVSADGSLRAAGSNVHKDDRASSTAAPDSPPRN